MPVAPVAPLKPVGPVEPEATGPNTKLLSADPELKKTARAYNRAPTARVDEYISVAFWKNRTKLPSYTTENWSVVE
jgi:hypothetical protein